MAKFAVLYGDEREGVLEDELLKAHLEYLDGLHARRRLLLFGPFGKDDGKALLIFEADSRKEVEAYVLGDPFIVHKWYARFFVYEWREVSGGAPNN